MVEDNRTSLPWADFSRAAQRAGVSVQVGDDHLEAAQRICDLVWPPLEGGTQLGTNLLKAFVHSGGYVSVAYDGDTPVGATIGITGRHQRDGQWHSHIHSHMAAVLEGYRDRSIGTAMKLHQRAWSLDQGIDTVVWTFDPLVRRNLMLNVLKLGVDVRGYEPNFYGEMNDGINSGDYTDRVFAWWELESERALIAARGDSVPIVPTAGEHRVVELPSDIVALRGSDPAAALEWRLRVRDELMSAFAAGWTVEGVSPEGHYVLKESAA